MRIVLFFMAISVTQALALDSYAQSTKLSLSFKDEPIVKILDKIEDESEFYFMYDATVVNVNQKSSINCENKTVSKILDELFQNTGITYKIEDRQIALSSRADSPEISPKEIYQQLTVSGRVADSSGLPLPGVTVVVKGTTQGTVTNADGEYSLINIPEDATLQFSFVGMLTQEVVVGNQTSINVTMMEDLVDIEEVVAIGYGTQKRVNLTGSVGVATSERLENRPIVSAGQGLQGVIPNLNIKYQTGSPTDSPDFNIRGFESINGGSPLILVDGVPMELERINPNNISSVTVLKDASAAAVYGARAAFGVILVETKKGREGKVNVTLSTEQSIAKPIFNLDPVTDPYVYVTEINIANDRTYGSPAYDDNYVQGAKKWSETPTEENAWGVYNGVLRYYGFNDYKNKMITDFSPQKKYDLTVSGASKTNSYYVSFGFLDKDGYLRNKEKNESYKRYNILMKVDFQITDWLNIDEKITFNSQVSDKPHIYMGGSNDLNSVARMPPLVPLKFPDLPYYIVEGDHDQYAQYIGMDYNRLNFIPYLEQGGRETWTTNDTWLTQGLTLTPLKGFRIRSDFSYRIYWRDYQDVASKIVVLADQGQLAELPLLQTNLTNHGYSLDDWVNNQFDRSQYYVFNIYGEYEMKGIKDHYLKAMVGFNQEWGRNNYIRAMAKSLITPSVTDLNATTGTQRTWGGKGHVSLRGAFYRLNYIYKDKYLFEASGRYDGTSRFPKESRFGFFPSGSVGWRVSKEPFMVFTEKWINNLKLRASYGVLGNQLLASYYPYITTMGSGMSNYQMSSAGKIPYISAPGLVSGELTWESVTTRNIGIDFTLLDNKLDISFDAYTRDTKDMLMSVEYPDILGAASPQENAADLRTKGWELSATWRTRFGQDLRYGLTLALSDNQAEITSYENPTGSINEYYVGKKIGEIWGFKTVGIFQYDQDAAAAPDQSQIGANWRAGDMQYADLNNDGKITRGTQTLDDPGDLTIIGNSSPRYSFGINHDLSFKNWSLNVFFQGLFRDFLPRNTSHSAFYPFNSQILQKSDISESWSEDNRDAYFSAPTALGETKNIQPQSRFVQNAAYIRLKNLTLNYNLSSRLAETLGLSKVQVYFSGMNLWEYSKIHKTLDPEQRDNLSQAYYFQRIFTLGAKITF